jgi:hypothetical protein
MTKKAPSPQIFWAIPQETTKTRLGSVPRGLPGAEAGQRRAVNGPLVVILRVAAEPPKRLATRAGQP